jgi:hypothetical protein
MSREPIAAAFSVAATVFEIGLGCTGVLSCILFTDYFGGVAIAPPVLPFPPWSTVASGRHNFVVRRTLVHASLFEGLSAVNVQSEAENEVTLSPPTHASFDLQGFINSSGTPRKPPS